MRARKVQLIAVIASAPLLLVLTVAAAWHAPDYSGWRDTVSRLGSAGQPWAPAVRASFVVYGLLVAVGVPAIVQGRRSGRIASAALYGFATAAIVAGLAPKDLRDAPHTIASDVHVCATILGGIALLVAMAAIARSEPSNTRRTVTAVAAVVVVSATTVFRFTWGSPYYGAVERVVVAQGMSWVVLAALWSWPARTTPVLNSRPQA